MTARWPIAIVVSLLLSHAAFNLYRQHNNFPVHYHPDEGSKVSQVRDDSGRRNFNHPLLMLRVAAWYIDFHQTPDERLDTVVAGRDASAMLAAGAVFCLTLAAFAVYGITGLLITGPTLALCPPLLTYAHYFKEDTSLIFGIAVAVLGTALLTRGRGVAWQPIGALILGAGVALSASGKYVGVATLAPALLAIVLAFPARDFAMRFGWQLMLLHAVLLTAVPLAVWINAEAFSDPWLMDAREHVVDHVEGEYEHATTEHGFVRLETPSNFCLNIAVAEVMPHAWVLLGVGMVGWLLRPRITRWGVACTMFFITYALVLRYNALPFGRYALPMSVLGLFLITCLLAHGLTNVARLVRQWLSARRGIVMQPALLAMLVMIGPTALAWGRCADINAQVLDDSRQRVRRWIAENIPPQERIVVDQYTGLRHDGDDYRFPDDPPVRNRIYGGSFAPLAERRLDVQYVVVAEPSFGRFFTPDIAPAQGEERRFNQIKSFYENLFATGELLWQSTPTTVTHSYINPEIRVYRLPR